MRLATSMLLFLLLTLASVRAADPLVVISMRQYLIQGSSRIHLYLYAMDGTFKKALTSDNDYNDLDPVFSDDAQSIQFTRVSAKHPHSSKEEKFVIDLATGAIRPSDLANDYFFRVTCDEFSDAFSPESQGWINIDRDSYQSPDGKFTLQRKADANNPCNYQVALQGKGLLPIVDLPGFIRSDQSLRSDHVQICNGSPFVTDRSDMELIFLSHHLNSTDGDELWALDLTAMRGAKIAQNGAMIYHPPSASGVFVVTEDRYQPLGDTDKTVNCTHLEWWDAHLKQVRFGPALSVCYSAAIYGGQDYTSVIIPSRE